MLTTDFTKTLEAVARILNDDGHEWVVFGGAAMVLHGFDIGTLSDIDIIVSAATAAWLMEKLPVENQADTGSSRFRSDYFLRPNLGPTPVEIMANFKIHSGGNWHWIRPTNVTGVRVGRPMVFTPEVNELAKIFDLCGQAKDIARSQIIKGTPEQRPLRHFREIPT
jgi:hypothetical protein